MEEFDESRLPDLGRLPPQDGIEKVKNWQAENPTGNPETFQELPDDREHWDESSEPGTDEDVDELSSDFDKYREVIKKTPAHDWLLEKLRKELLLDTTKSTSMKEINGAIIDSLPQHPRINKRRNADAYRSIFTIDWDPIKYHKEQRFKETLDQALERAITLTGSLNDAQALTTAQYLSQIWPTTGMHILTVVKDVLTGSTSEKCTRKFATSHFHEQELICQKSFQMAQKLKHGRTKTSSL